MREPTVPETNHADFRAKQSAKRRAIHDRRIVVVGIKLLRPCGTDAFTTSVLDAGWGDWAMHVACARKCATPESHHALSDGVAVQQHVHV